MYKRPASSPNESRILNDQIYSWEEKKSTKLNMWIGMKIHQMSIVTCLKIIKHVHLAVVIG